MALSGPRLAVANRTAVSRWLFLAHVWPSQIVLPNLGGSFSPTLLPSLGCFFYHTFGCNKSYCGISVALSAQLLAVTTRTAF